MTEQNNTPEQEFTEDLPGQSGSSLHLKKKNPWRIAKEIDVEKLKEFLAVNMPVHRIAQYFGTTKETLYNKFGDIIIESNVHFEHQLRLAQMKAANDLNPTMLIWLGKNILNQVDSSKVEVQQTEKPSVGDIKFVPLSKD